VRKATLDNYLVGDCEQRRRDRQDECLSGRKIDDEIEFGRLLDRDVARFCPPQKSCRQTRRRAGYGGEAAGNVASK
jgi:hypothetical protein